MPVARIVERQPHLLKQAKLDEQTEWAKYENMTLSPKAKANIHHKAHTGLRIYHYHTDHLGTPQELTNDRGEVVWLNYQMAWGGSFSQLNHVYNLDGLDVSADELQPFRFQGQFFDGETGLHYNRFRYYDSDVGMFISRDPIGLLGGSNVFQYAPNPVRWIDPWGLAKLHKNNKNYEGNFSLYSVWEDDSRTEILKIGKADADDIMPTTGDVRRMHTSLRKAQVNYPKAVAGITLELGKTTTGNAEAIEASQVRALREQGHKLPLNKERRKAYHPEKPPTKGKNSCTK